MNLNAQVAPSTSHHVAHSSRVRVSKKFSCVLVFLCLCSSLLASNANATDPWRGVNESIYGFNVYLDKLILRPVAQTYGAVLPAPVRQGVGNFFSNIDDINEALNNLLQGKVSNAVSDSGRFVINTTLGVAGIFDVASEFGLRKHEEDFGQTLAVWGIGSGPYVMLPFFGASTVRDSFGLIADTLANPLSHHEDSGVRVGTFAVNEIHSRHGLLILDDLVTFDEYLFLREGYLQRRNYLINDGVVEDEFGSF